LSAAATKQIQVFRRKDRPFTRIQIRSDDADWVLREIALELQDVSMEIGLNASADSQENYPRRQCIFELSKYAITDRDYFLKNKTLLGNRLALAYYHGSPESDPKFEQVFQRLSSKHHLLDRVQVSCRTVENLIKETGIDEQKVHRIPISFDDRKFSPPDAKAKATIRESYGIPQSAFVLGSFQKDGVGFGDGFEPKWIKGPDVLVDACAAIKELIPELFVFLTGPARGYVKQRLSEIKVPYVHHEFGGLDTVARCYQALDLYLITAREEGGPRAVLESMASGVPVVSSRVGQAIDLIHHGVNGWLTDVADIEAAAYWASVAVDETTRRRIIEAGLATASKNCYRSQEKLWRKFFKNFVS